MYYRLADPSWQVGTIFNGTFFYWIMFYKCIYVNNNIEKRSEMIVSIIILCNLPQFMKSCMTQMLHIDWKGFLLSIESNTMSFVYYTVRFFTELCFINAYMLIII
jgi:hypothetical protein